MGLADQGLGHPSWNFRGTGLPRGSTSGRDVILKILNGELIAVGSLAFGSSAWRIMGFRVIGFLVIGLADHGLAFEGLGT